MAVISKDTVSAANDVISICKDAQEGFRAAADAVNNPTLKQTFEQLSSQRGAFARELETLVNKMGGDADDPAGTKGKLHGAWIKLKGAVTGHSEHEILEETERGEDLSVKTFQDALGKDLTPEIRSVLQNQYQQVQRAHNQIRALRDSTSR